MIKLLKGDCLEIMETMPAGVIDAILTDPPYELSKSKGGGMMAASGKNIKEDCGRKFMEQVKEANMINGIDIVKFLDKCLSLFLKKQQFCGVFFCSTKQIIKYVTWAENNKLQYGVGVWHKTNPAPLCNCKYLNDVEYWIYIKGNKSKILGSYHSKSMVYTSKVNKKDKTEFGHLTCKPVELIEKFIINHTPDNESTVFDPFMGSCATGVACVNTNRSFIGIELDETYFNIAEKRIAEAK